jgi:hypothetical protein
VYGADDVHDFARRAILAELRLQPGDRLRGTPAAPEPLASRGHFYDDQQLAPLAREAGMRDVEVKRDRGGQLLVARA